jgi:hypothetical protein
MSKPQPQIIDVNLSDLEEWAYADNDRPEDPGDPFMDLSCHFEAVSEVTLICDDKFAGSYTAMGELSKLLNDYAQTGNPGAANNPHVLIPTSMIQPLLNESALIAKDIISQHEREPFYPLMAVETNFYLGLTALQKKFGLGAYADPAFNPAEDAVISDLSRQLTAERERRVAECPKGDLMTLAINAMENNPG